jgi:glycosyltransferase involved in cell wall biosynthesis
VILATYDQPRWLEKVLWGYASQTFGDFELVVADDGSGPETAEVIRELRTTAGLAVRHVWQEDRGFRKTRILNRAILRSEGNYLIFSDGDCIPREDFVEVHCRHAEEGRYLSGGAVPLSRELSERISAGDVRSGRAFDVGWLRRRGWRPGRRCLRVLRSRLAATVLDFLTPTGATWNGGNASTWREAVLAVNGFEESMGYGGEDRAFGERLVNLGLRGKQVRHRAVCLHLDHDRPYATSEGRNRNERIRARIRREGEIRAREGLDGLRRGDRRRFSGEEGRETARGEAGEAAARGGC